MSNRSIIEINHDFAGLIECEEKEIGLLLVQALRSGDKESWEPLQRYGIRFGLMAHHSNHRFCGWSVGGNSPDHKVTFP